MKILKNFLIKSFYLAILRLSEHCFLRAYFYVAMRIIQNIISPQTTAAVFYAFYDILYKIFIRYTYKLFLITDSLCKREIENMNAVKYKIFIHDLHHWLSAAAAASKCTDMLWVYLCHVANLFSDISIS